MIDCNKLNKAYKLVESYAGQTGDFVNVLIEFDNLNKRTNFTLEDASGSDK